MSNNTIQNLRGFRDFLPSEKRKRDFVSEKIKKTFESFGFEPIETPTLEYASLLLGKYGDEADKLVYSFTDRGEREVALRYDQTVPTARVLAQYQNELPKYFRRYQIQNVFRADKPQKGRFREFSQCDIDIFGSTSPLADAEVLAVFSAVYEELGVKNLKIKINDRQTLLNTLQPFASERVDIFSIIQSIDKLDKLSQEQVIDELVEKGLDKDQAQQTISTIQQSEPSDNLSQIITLAQQLGVPESALIFEPTLARGLDYYTGLIFEGIIPEYKVGSIGGGGRYDNLIQNLSGLNMPAVGFGIGFDRTVEAADQLGLIPTGNTGTQVLLTVFDDSTLDQSLQAADQLRQAGIRTEVYPAVDKLGKQFKLADQKNIPFVIIIGEEEMKQNKLTIKNMKTGEQKLLSLEEIISFVK